MTLGYLVATGVACGLAVGCGGGATTGGTHPAMSNVVISVSRDDGSLLPSCGVRQTARRLLVFIDAFNRGDGRALDDQVAGDDRFQWFAVSTAGRDRGLSLSAVGKHGVTDLDQATTRSQRPRLLQWLAQRHQAGERLRLIDLAVSRVRARSWVPLDEELAGVEYRIQRRSPDFSGLGGPNRVASGKGAVSCRDGRLVVWAMGLDTHHPAPPRQCPAARLPADRPHVIVCTGLAH